MKSTIHRTSQVSFSHGRRGILILMTWISSILWCGHWLRKTRYLTMLTYSAFPYGIRENMLERYADALLSYDEGRKTTTVKHLKVSLTHPSRSILPPMPSLRPQAYYDEIISSQFLLSPRGDRPDTYRHWEAIGLGAIPISNINRSCFGSLFGQNMLYVSKQHESNAGYIFE